MMSDIASSAAHFMASGTVLPAMTLRVAANADTYHRGEVRASMVFRPVSVIDAVVEGPPPSRR
jgi:hypothetical protein